METGTVKWFNH